MKNGNTAKKGTRKTAGQAVKKGDQSISNADLSRIEFHRHGFALVPDPADKRPGVAYYVEAGASKLTQRYCSCSTSASRTCVHLLELMKTYKAFKKGNKKKNPAEDFRTSIWYRIASVLAENCMETPKTISMGYRVPRSSQDLPDPGETEGNESVITVLDSEGKEILIYLSRGSDAPRFLERCGKSPEEDAIPNRGTVLERLALLTLTKNERMMMDRGFKTRGQSLEESFWYRVAYHGYRELGATGYTLHPAIGETTGQFTVLCKSSSGAPCFRMIIPRGKVKKLLDALDEFLPNQHNLAIHPIPLKSIFKVSMNTQLDLEVRPLIQVIQEDGEDRFFEREGLERFQYGNLVYIRELGVIAELEQPGRMERKFRAPIKMVLKKSQVPEFLEEFGDELRGGPHLIDADVERRKVFTRADRIEIIPNAIDRDWCWLSVMYGFENTAISLADILAAKNEGQRYLGIQEGWIDCGSPDLEGLGALINMVSDEQLSETPQGIKLSRMDLFRLAAASSDPMDVGGNGDKADLLRKILETTPMKAIPPLKGLSCNLRPYQKRGVEWIRFLYENRFGGLLCDEMGLGKTHEVMAFMVFLREHEKRSDPFLVVCPTTVLFHWMNKIRDHAPALNPVAYHGGERDLEEALKQGDVLITSYGIVRRDIKYLKEVPFTLAVFDEIQNIKNPQTIGHVCAKDVRTEMKLGLTGTPIENRLNELKALLDLTLPGYLGTDGEFDTRYTKPIEIESDDTRRKELSRLISPFTLRRRKASVLDDLPEKIEDLRTCRLSEDQVKLYRDAISARGKGLLEILRDREERVPYMHVFALLNLLKQICNHPVMLEEQRDNYDQYESGKWELFKELLAESLDSGQKVVVYSQYLGMIDIIERYLNTLDVGFVTLTGKSRNRGDIVSRFNTDPACRIYVGSLKAGGVGIDLVAASVVIHYDRWWNAAKEDQATDRVHRIGQQRGVQVFKLVTEGTLEEKISAIIERKRDLMDGVVQENDPGLLKAFSREELIELLATPF